MATPLFSAPTSANFEYNILPGHFHPGFRETALYNQSFLYWREFWNGVYRANGSSDTINELDFLRTEMVTVVTSGSEIVAMHLYSVLNLEMASTVFHPYLNATGDTCFIDLLRESKCRSAMPLEYLTINENWRKSKTGLSLSPVMIALGCRVQKELGIDAIIGRARSDIKINDRMIDAGSVILRAGVMMHNTPTDFCAIFLNDQKEHPDSQVRDLVARLWDNRRDHTGLTLGRSTTRQAA